MINEPHLKDALISLAKAYKLSAEIEAAQAVEIGVLRETVRALDPTFSENFDHRKKEAITRTAPQFAVLLEKSEKIIRILESDYIC